MRGGGGGGGREYGAKNIFMQGRMTEKKLCQDEVKEKNSTVRLTNCIRLNGTLAATSVLQF